MYRYLFFIFVITSICTSKTFSKFTLKNSNFVQSPNKLITFKYNNNLEGFPNSGSGKIFIDSTKYKIDLGKQIIMVNDKVLKRYNVNTNQLFIENSHPTVDSIFFNFFNNNFLDLIYENKNDYNLNFKFNLDSTDIVEISAWYQNYNIKIYDIKFTYQNIDNSTVFMFNYPEAFIFDLRD